MLLGFTGDLFLGKAERSPDAFAELARQLPKDVRLVVNFEGTLYDEAEQLRPARQKILLDSPTTLLPLLDPLPIALASVGNNHIGDYGNDIAGQTMARLHSRFPVFGAGFSDDDFHLTTERMDGVNVGFANYCTGDTSPLFSSATIFGPRKLELHRVAADLNQLKSNARFCIAIVHWGVEDFHHPRPALRRLGRSLIDGGFDLVIGHHSHTAQGYERHRDGWIFYSLGNFFFPDHSVMVNGKSCSVKWMPSRSWGLIPFFSLSRSRLALERVCVVRHARNEAPQLSESRWLKTKLDRLCQDLDTRRYVRAYRSMCWREGWRVRWEEFLNNENKSRAVMRKMLGLVRAGRNAHAN